MGIHAMQSPLPRCAHHDHRGFRCKNLANNSTHQYDPKNDDSIPKIENYQKLLFYADTERNLLINKTKFCECHLKQEAFNAFKNVLIQANYNYLADVIQNKYDEAAK